MVLVDDQLRVVRFVDAAVFGAVIGGVVVVGSVVGVVVVTVAQVGDAHQVGGRRGRDGARTAGAASSHEVRRAQEGARAAEFLGALHGLRRLAARQVLARGARRRLAHDLLQGRDERVRLGIGGVRGSRLQQLAHDRRRDRNVDGGRGRGASAILGVIRYASASDALSVVVQLLGGGGGGAVECRLVVRLERSRHGWMCTASVRCARMRARTTVDVPEIEKDCAAAVRSASHGRQCAGCSASAVTIGGTVTSIASTNSSLEDEVPAA